VRTAGKKPHRGEWFHSFGVQDAILKTLQDTIGVCLYIGHDAPLLGEMTLYVGDMNLFMARRPCVCLYSNALCENVPSWRFFLRRVPHVSMCQCANLCLPQRASLPACRCVSLSVSVRLSLPRSHPPVLLTHVRLSLCVPVFSCLPLCVSHSLPAPVFMCPSVLCSLDL
jgi:hypothetical protein